MQRKTSHRFRLAPAHALGAAIASVLITAAASGQVALESGLVDLINRVGAGNQPTGAGIGVGQAEGQESAGNAYPNFDLPEFAGKTFTPMSGAFGDSGHATTVGQYIYSSTNVNSIAPGVSSIFMYEANSWLQSGFLRLNTAFEPLAPPSGLRVYNNSWNGDGGGFNNEILRRADYAADRINAQDVLMVSGLQNSPTGTGALMAFSYNGLSVGRSDGGHSPGTVPAGIDGPGRRIPLIVAPDDNDPKTPDFTSWATGVVSAAAALMYQTAQTPPLSSNANARKSETIKCVLLAGANHRAGWSNNPATSGPTRGVTSTPLSPTWGVDVVNVDRSHRILTGGEQNGSATLPSANTIGRAAWDIASMNANATLHYRFSLAQPADKVSILTTWHRTVATNFASFTLANFELELKRINASGQAVSLVGDAGLPYFGGGNVLSQSGVENIEHLYITNLAAGSYVIELRRLNDGVAAARDVALAWIMPANPVDVNNDGSVDIDDLLAVISGWGNCPVSGPCPADVNGDDVVNIDDLLAVISAWGA